MIAMIISIRDGLVTKAANALATAVSILVRAFFVFVMVVQTFDVWHVVRLVREIHVILLLK